MKKLLILSLIFISAFTLMTLTSCSKDDGDSNFSVEDVRYYVKYEVSFQTEFRNTVRHVAYTDEKGRHTLTFSELGKEMEWNGTYGPVDKNFVASLNCSTEGNNIDVIHARIYVSREKEPFVIKAEGNNAANHKPLSLSYAIDF